MPGKFVQQEQQRSSSSSRFILAALLASLLVLALMAGSAEADELVGGGEGELTAMVDAIKYLQGLDKVYGQAARPSARKRKKKPDITGLMLDDAISKPRRSTDPAGSEQHLAGELIRLLQMQQLDRQYDAARIRPRFGKRGRWAGSMPDFEDLPAGVVGGRHHQQPPAYY